eukprot:3235656-Rhodomonas_salina.1
MRVEYEGDVKMEECAIGGDGWGDRRARYTPKSNTRNRIYSTICTSNALHSDHVPFTSVADAQRLQFSELTSRRRGQQSRHRSFHARQSRSGLEGLRALGLRG